MGKSFLADTNIAARFIAEDLSEKGKLFLEAGIEENKIYISVINRIELLSWKVDKPKERLISIFLKNVTEYPIQEKVIDKTIEIRRNYKIRLPDAIIAATCLAHKLILLTDNEADFNKIKGLKIINPTKEF